MALVYHLSAVDIIIVLATIVDCCYVYRSRSTLAMRVASFWRWGLWAYTLTGCSMYGLWLYPSDSLDSAGMRGPLEYSFAGTIAGQLIVGWPLVMLFYWNMSELDRDLAFHMWLVLGPLTSGGLFGLIPTVLVSFLGLRRSLNAGE